MFNRIIALLLKKLWQLPRHLNSLTIKNTIKTQYWVWKKVYYLTKLYSKGVTIHFDNINNECDLHSYELLQTYDLVKN